MEKNNWIKAYYTVHDGDDEREIFVRQEVEGSGTFVDNEGNRYHISELDLTRNTFEPQIAPVEKTDGLKWLLESMDANAIADHKAKIDEREYWRKLRGETFSSLRKEYRSEYDALKQTEFIINHLYAQDQEFFKDK